MTARERTGLLVVRAWTEGNERSLRARLIWSPDIKLHPEVVTTTGSPEQLFATIHDWLDMLLAGPPYASSTRAAGPGDGPVMDP
jgi:hypothetical protein